MSLEFWKTVTFPGPPSTRLRSDNPFVHPPHRALHLESPARSLIRLRHPISHARAIVNPCHSVAFASLRRALWPHSIQLPLVTHPQPRRHHIDSQLFRHPRVSSSSAQRSPSRIRAHPIPRTTIRLPLRRLA